MARPLKTGLDYFSHDTDACGDEKLDALRSKYGNDGYAFYFICLERIYRTKDGSLDITNDLMRLTLMKKIAVKEKMFNSILQDCFEVGLFDKEAYEQRKILTSNGIQKRMREANKLRLKWRKDKDREELSTEKTPQGKPSKKTPEETGESKEKERKENVVIEKFLTTMTENNIGVDETDVRMRVPKMLDDYGMDTFECAVNKAMESWKTQGNTGTFFNYLGKIIHDEYRKRN